MAARRPSQFGFTAFRLDFWLGLKTLSGIVPPMRFSPAQDVKAEAASHDAWLKPGRFAALLALLVLAAYPQVILGLQTFVYRDFGVFSYPIAHYLRESFWRGEIPLWNPLSNYGAPFLAQWNPQVLYPPALFYLLFPLSWSLGVFCLLHLFWGGLGMFLLARCWTQNRLAAAFAGIVFAFNGLMLSSLIWPATVSGLGWMPWVVWLTEQAWREGGRKLVAAAIAGALQMLAGAPEIVLLTWGLVGALGLKAIIRGEFPRWKIPLRVFLVVLLVAGLSAAQLLPFFDLLDYSRRQQGMFDTVWPMPAAGWANFFVPLFHSSSVQGAFLQNGQTWINSYYTGVVTVVLALGAAAWVRRGRIGWLLLPALVCFILALGEATPVYGWLLRHFGALGMMRFPVKFLILPVFVLPLLAAFALSVKSPGAGTNPVRWSWVMIWAATVLLLLGICGWEWRSVSPSADRTAALVNGLMRAIFFTAIAGVWFWAGRTRTPDSRRLCQLLFLLLVWLDLYQQMPLPKTVGRTVYQTRLPRLLPAPQWGEARVLIPSVARTEFFHRTLPDAATDYLARRFALSDDCNLLEGVPKCDGFFPLYLSDYAGLFYNFYNDRLPAEPLLDFLGVAQTFVVQTNRCEWVPRATYMPLLTGGQKPVFADDWTTLQGLTNANFQPRQMVYLPPEAKPFVTASNRAGVTFSHSRFSPQRIEADVVAEAPALLVMAQTYYHPWQAYVDGRPVPLWRANYTFQALQIPAGPHQVKLVYEDRRFKLGAVISLATLMGCLIFHCFGRHQPKPAAEELVK